MTHKKQTSYDELVNFSGDMLGWLLVAAVFFLWGCMVGMTSVRNEAIKSGHANYVETTNGNTEFKWNQQGNN